MIYVSTSNGIYFFNELDFIPKKLQTSKDSLGYYGLAYNKSKNQLLIASRAKLRFTFKSMKRSSDVTLLAFNEKSESVDHLGDFYKVYDVHQIAFYEGKLFITDTSLNRIHIYDLSLKKKLTILNLGKVRKDVHHINTIKIHNSSLLIGLNNRGNKESEVMFIPLEKINFSQKKIDAFNIFEKIIKINGLYHSHDLEPFHDDFLINSSHDSQVVSFKTGKSLLKTNGFSRGLAIDTKYIYVGISPLVSRSERYSKTIDGKVQLFDFKTFKLLHEIILPGANQVNDILITKN